MPPEGYVCLSSQINYCAAIGFVCDAGVVRETVGSLQDSQKRALAADTPISFERTEEKSPQSPAPLSMWTKEARCVLSLSPELSLLP